MWTHYIDVQLNWFIDNRWATGKNTCSPLVFVYLSGATSSFQHPSSLGNCRSFFFLVLTLLHYNLIWWLRHILRFIFGWGPISRLNTLIIRICVVTLRRGPSVPWYMWSYFPSDSLHFRIPGLTLITVGIKAQLSQGCFYHWLHSRICFLSFTLDEGWAAKLLQTQIH